MSQKVAQRACHAPVLKPEARSRRAGCGICCQMVYRIRPDVLEVYRTQTYFR
jgi:hypothetical protein